jgi:TonB family protein
MRLFRLFLATFTSSLALAPALMAQTVDKPLKIGGSVRVPTVIHQVDPQTTEEMMKARTDCPSFSMVVDEQGVPQKVRLVHGSGSQALDTVCLKAVQEYRFRPAAQFNRPVPVELYMDVCVD